MSVPHMAGEKGLYDQDVLPLPTQQQTPTAHPERKRWFRTLVFCSVVAWFLFSCATTADFATAGTFDGDVTSQQVAISDDLMKEKLCPQSQPLSPQGVLNKAFWDVVQAKLGTSFYQKKAIEWLGGAVRVP
jgi:hypothetical protein